MGFFSKVAAAGLRTLTVPATAVWDTATAIPRAVSHPFQHPFETTRQQLKKVARDLEGAMEDLEDD